MATQRNQTERHHQPDYLDIDRKFTLLLVELQEIRREQREHRQLLGALLTQGERLMAVSQELQDALAEIDTATNAVADEITVLIGRITTGMSPEDVSSVVTGLKAKAARLTQIASDPEQPVPPVETPPTDTGTPPTARRR